MRELRRNFILFFKGIFAYSPFWLFWIFLLTLFNFTLPFLFIQTFIAQIVLISAYSGLLIGLYLVGLFGFKKILGLMHAPWIPMIYFQIHVLLNNRPEGLFKYWLVGSFLVSIISIIIDFFDVITYYKKNIRD